MVTMGLAAIAQEKTLHPQTFKKGPDFIDPMWMSVASGRPCYNLDPHQQSLAEIVNLYSKHSMLAQCSFVEGTMGIHDGLEDDGSDSNAAIAKLLQLPVLLVIDCRGMHRTVAALLQGIEQFDKKVIYAGVILNRLKTVRHGTKIQQAIQSHTDLEVLGVIPDSDAIGIDEQNLGLIPEPDHNRSARIISAMSQLLREHCDCHELFASPNGTETTVTERTPPIHSSAAPKSLRIGIAQDEAFNFYYQDDLDYFDSVGVEMVPLSPLHSTLPSDLDGLVIGGGFPEHHAKKLSENVSFLSTLNHQIAEGLPVHAECAGLMYLCRTIRTRSSESWSMVGSIDAAITMRSKPVGRGYMQLARLKSENEIFWAHEFHHSEIKFDSTPEFVYRVKRGHGIDGDHDGVRVFNVVATYAHFRHTEATPWIDWFLSRVYEHKTSQSECLK